jgi:sulfur carrier protein
MQYVKRLDTPGARASNPGARIPVIIRTAQPSLVIQLSINGEPRDFPAPLDLARLIDDLALAGKKVAVERNGEIVPRSRYADTPLADGDRLEIVVAVGGG